MRSRRGLLEKGLPERGLPERGLPGAPKVSGASKSVSHLV